MSSRCSKVAQVRLKKKKKKTGIVSLSSQLTSNFLFTVQEGFWFHHAEPKYLMLAFWIPEGSHTLPANASHRVTIGAFVMNEKREVILHIYFS